jgi:monothiol glutaredoxin
MGSVLFMPDGSVGKQVRTVPNAVMPGRMSGRHPDWYGCDVDGDAFIPEWVSGDARFWRSSTVSETAAPTIVAYLKPVCGWSNSVRAVLQKHGLVYEDRDIINDRSNYSEMVRKSGQPLSPCVEINGVMLADVAGNEVEEYLVEQGLAKAEVAAV